MAAVVKSVMARATALLADCQAHVRSSLVDSWKGNDTTFVRDMLHGFGKPFVIALAMLLLIWQWETADSLAVIRSVLWGGVAAGVLIVGWRRRVCFAVDLQLIYVVLFLANYLKNRPLVVATDLPDFSGALISFATFFGLLYFGRERIIKFARLEPAMEL